MFSPNGLRILTASGDNTIRIWDAASGKQLAELRGLSYLVLSAVFSPDDLRVLTTSPDNTVRIWEVPEYPLERFLARDPGRDFTCDERRQHLHENCTSP